MSTIFDQSRILELFPVECHPVFFTPVQEFDECFSNSSADSQVANTSSTDFSNSGIPLVTRSVTKQNQSPVGASPMGPRRYLNFPHGVMKHVRKDDSSDRGI